ncbi:MAG: GTPase ObgE [Acidobacteriota bacterium]|nr:GTPase ObgE [Acidobacteriota bacterium]
MIFIDEAVIPVRGGDGGNGCLAFRREKFVPRGGPSGGDGGHGGSVYLVGDGGLNTLYHLRVPGAYVAERGHHGEGSNKTGRTGEDLELRVPLGTQVYDEATEALVGEVLEDGQRLRVAAGGLGGRGNARFATSTNRAPRHHEPGRPGEERSLRLQLKLLADVGLVGLPNAGKSTLLSTLSSARPKVAGYPFTTLSPQLGVVALSDYEEPMVLADLPGLIEGAAGGAGLGTRFLRHAERCRVLVHLVDLSSLEEESDAAADLLTVEEELKAYSTDLIDRPRIIVGSKADAVREERRAQLQAAAEQRELPYLEISSATRDGLKPLVGEIRRLLDEVDEQRAAEEAAERRAERASGQESEPAEEESSPGDGAG